MTGVQTCALPIYNHLLTEDAPPSKSYAYISDTKYLPELAEKLKGIDLLYHEATFLNDKLERAQETYHTTALQAGVMASKSEVKRLIIGHFSARYKNLYPLLEEARLEFENSTLAIEGDIFKV